MCINRKVTSPNVHELANCVYDNLNYINYYVPVAVHLIFNFYCDTLKLIALKFLLMQRLQS